MRHLVSKAGLEHAIEMDSAGTAGYHCGEPPDARARAAGKRAGIVIGGKARKLERRDFDTFDYVIAMDGSNLEDLERLAPAALRHKIALLRSFDPAAPPGAEVPDPYYGGDEGFDHVISLCERACTGLLERIRQEHGL